MTAISFGTKFNLTLTPKQFIFNDSSDYAGQGISVGDVNGCFRITSPSGIVVYNNTDFSDANCDILIDTSLVNQTVIGLVLATNGLPELGLYTIEYSVYDKNLLTTYTKTSTYANAYARPIVAITQTVDCLSPLFYSIDATNYVVDGITPDIDRTNTIDYPYGSAGEGVPTVGTTATVSVSTFYQGTQTTEIESELTYTFDDGLIVIDVVSGVKEIVVDCKDVCGIVCCIRTLEQRMIGYSTTNKTLFEETKALFNQVMSEVGFAYLLIRCGKSDYVNSVLAYIRTIANCTEDCDCSGTEPTQVVGIGGLVNEVIVDSGGTPVIVTPVTIGNTTTYTVALDPSFINNVNREWTQIFANAGARAAGVPDFDGQLGVQLDTNVVYEATGLSAGNWQQVNFFKAGAGSNSLMTLNATAAAGVDAIAVGITSSAAGDESTALGRNANASGNNSTSIGESSAASQGSATAVGSASNAAGTYSIAVGYLSSGAASNSTAVGGTSSASATSTTAIGYGASATTATATSLGKSAAATGGASVSIGNSSASAGLNAVSIGNTTSASTQSSVAIGDSAASSGASAIAIGLSSSSTASGAVSFGGSSSSTGVNSVAMGLSSNASQLTSIAIGKSATTAGAGGIGIGNGITASGATAIAIGNLSTSSASASVALGASSSSTGADATALGASASSTAASSTALGTSASATGISATAIGDSATARITKTVNASGTIITRKDSSEGDYQLSFSGAVVTITGPEVDLKVVADTTSITIPTGSIFFPDEVDLILTTSTNNVTGQPTVRAGGDVSTASLLAAVGTTALTLPNHRQRFATLVTSTGQQVLTAGVTVGATGTTVKGRFIFRGILLEVE